MHVLIIKIEKRKVNSFGINLVNNFRKCNIHKALLFQPKNWYMQLFSLGRNLYNERMTDYSYYEFVFQ